MNIGNIILKQLIPSKGTYTDMSWVQISQRNLDVPYQCLQSLWSFINAFINQI